jgi:hypothetical protein
MTRRLTPLLTPLIEDPETESLVRDVLQAGRQQDVAGYDYEAGLKRHLGVIAAGAPMPDWAKGLETGTSTTTTATATGAGATAVLGSAVTWVVVPVVTAAVIAAAMWARSPEPTPAGPMHGVAPGAEVQVQAPGIEQAQPLDQPAPSALLPSAAPSDDESSDVVVTRAPRTRATRASGATATTGKRLSGPAQGTPSTSTLSGGDLFARARPVTSSTEPVAPAPSEQPVREAAEREQATAEQPAPQAPARLDDARLEREMGMLAVAQRVLHSDPSRTLLLVRQSAREFGDTMFAPERGQLELLALVKLGKLDDAKRLARPYLARYPNGPFSDRVRRSLASGRVER